MTREDFSTWKIPYLQKFLASRRINRTGTKEMLVRNCFSAYELGLQETVTDFLREQNEVMKNHLDKLVIGKISLPDRYSLVDGWCNAPCDLPYLFILFILYFMLTIYTKLTNIQKYN